MCCKHGKTIMNELAAHHYFWAIDKTTLNVSMFNCFLRDILLADISRL